MYPTTSSSGATTNLPIRLACKNFVQPLLLHDQRRLSRPLGSAPPGSCSLPWSDNGIASVARVALFIAGVVRITLGPFIPTAGTGFYSGILLEARLTKLSADARRIPTTPPEVLAFLHFQHLHCLHHLHRHHD